MSAQLERLIQALQLQPGVGPRAATRIAYYLLDHRREDAKQLGQVLGEAMDKIKLCQCCRNYSDEDRCEICKNPKRLESGQLCVVESPSDVAAIEQSNHYFGRYFVLHGHLSPIDGIGAAELGLQQLAQILATGTIKELILATNPTIEGDATATFIASLAAKYQIPEVTKIASGVPLGGAVDTIDPKTLISSLMNRRPLSSGTAVSSGA